MIEAADIELTQVTGSSMHFTIRSDVDGTLLMPSLNISGWRVEVFAEPAVVMKSMPLQGVGLREVSPEYLALDLPKGQHRVRFVYSPTEFWLGFWISLLSWLALSIFVLLKTFRLKAA